MSNYYCGACGDVFSCNELLKKHLNKCVYVKHFQPVATVGAFGIDPLGMGHVSGFRVKAAKKRRSLIEKYVANVVYGGSTIERAGLHIEICDNFYLYYEKFKPFENPAIKKMPTFEEGLDIFLGALFLAEHKSNTKS